MTAMRGFTLLNISIITTVIAVLLVLAGMIALDPARPADGPAAPLAQKSLNAVTAALEHAYARHQQDGAPSDDLITAVAQIPALLPDGRLPEGLVIFGSALRDERGLVFALAPETAAAAARLIPLNAIAPEGLLPDRVGGEQHAYRNESGLPIPSK